MFFKIVLGLVSLLKKSSEWKQLSVHLYYCYVNCLNPNKSSPFFHLEWWIVWTQHSAKFDSRSFCRSRIWQWTMKHCRMRGLATNCLYSFLWYSTWLNIFVPKIMHDGRVVSEIFSHLFYFCEKRELDTGHNDQKLQKQNGNTLQSKVIFFVLR